MTSVSANGITVEYEDFGPENGPPLLLIMGLGGQLTLWPIELCHALVERGFRVIRYDNRDIGLSTKFDAAGKPDMAAVMTAVHMGKPPPVPYTLADMAADAAGLLDALGIAAAHVVGASMGGMIAQILAARQPDHVLSLTSIMSSSGNPALPPPRPEAMAVLTNRPTAGDAESIVAFSVQTARVIGSPAYPASEQRLRDRARTDFERSFSPEGFARQMAAAFASGDRRPELAAIRAPTLVIHGDADPLIPVEAGRDTAANIRDAELLVIPGMGHDLPLELHATIANAIRDIARR